MVAVNRSDKEMRKAHERHQEGTAEEYMAHIKSKSDKGEYNFYKGDVRNIAFMFDSNCVLCKERDEWKIEKKRRDDEEEEATARRQVEYQQQQWNLEQMAREDKPKVSPVAVVKKKLSDEENKQIQDLEIEKKLSIEISRNLKAQIDSITNGNDNLLTSAYSKCYVCNEDIASRSGVPSKQLFDAHMRSFKHLEKAGVIKAETYPRQCQECRFEADSKFQWIQHCSGKKHKVRTGQIQIVSEYPKRCQVCDYTGNTRHAFEQHCAGKKHLDKQV
jgi:hypothetical protein